MREAQLVLELAENLHRLDLTKDQRDEHIRRYAELLDARLQSQQNAPIESKRADGRGHRPAGIPRQIAEETGLSVDTVRRALNPKPAPEPKNPLSDHDVVTVQFNSLVAAWNRAGREARAMPSCVKLASNTAKVTQSLSNKLLKLSLNLRRKPARTKEPVA
jgi:hypothetical protein